MLLRVAAGEALDAAVVLDLEPGERLGDVVPQLAAIQREAERRRASAAIPAASAPVPLHRALFGGEDERMQAVSRYVAL